VERRGLTVPVAELAADAGGLPAGGDALLEPPHLPQGIAEVTQRRGFAALVACGGRRGVPAGRAKGR